jgi:eukaryotic-like serine/threonine-protein kinase
VDDTARALIGQTLGGRFRLTSFIGEGAMATVFRGAQDTEPREVAVKVLHPRLTADASFLRRFQREAQAAACVDHPNAVRVLDHGIDRDVAYIAMELCAGQDLFEVLAREHRLPPARAARIVLQVCAALDAAHRHGVVHRDLKPENVMLLHDAETPGAPGADLVKVLDFGIAKLLGRESLADDASTSRALESAITLAGALVGTPEYMSPEQARGTPPVDGRSDVYSCGVLLYQLVTGQVPFSGSTPMDVVLQHVAAEPPAPSTLVQSLHPGLERIILVALAKGRTQRQQSACALADALAAILPELDAGAPIAEASASPEPAAAQPKTRTLAAPWGAPCVETPAACEVAVEAQRPSRDDVARVEAEIARMEPARVELWSSPWAMAPPGDDPAPLRARRSPRGWIVAGCILAAALAAVVAGIWLAGCAG